jgi:uncharacterized membrane protein YdjX (TVP38/TMEM64 family)
MDDTKSRPNLASVEARTGKRLAIAAGAACVAVVVWSVWDHRAVMSWIERARPFPFFSVLAVLPAFGFPITPLFVLAGASFGIRLGIVGSLLALAANLTACYWIARWMRPHLEALLRRVNFRLPDLSDKSPARIVLGVKVAPGLPTFVKNYALGIIGVPFRLYFALSMLVTGVYAVLLVVLGESLLEHKMGRSVWVVAAVIVLGLVAGWRVRARRRSA